jgi:hypothetical protein
MTRRVWLLEGFATTQTRGDVPDGLALTINTIDFQMSETDR